jgi:hypothetical protein
MTTIRDTVPDIEIPPGTSEVEMPASLFRKQLHRLLAAVEERPALRVIITVSGRPVAEMRRAQRDALDPTTLLIEKSQEKSSEKSPPQPQPIHNAVPLPRAKR